MTTHDDILTTLADRCAVYSHDRPGHDKRMRLWIAYVRDHYRTHPEDAAAESRPGRPRLDPDVRDARARQRKLDYKARMRREQAARELTAWTYGRVS